MTTPSNRRSSSPDAVESTRQALTRDPQLAISVADAAAASMVSNHLAKTSKPLDGGPSFWSPKATEILRGAILAAASHPNRDIQDVIAWLEDGMKRDATEIVASNPALEGATKRFAEFLATLEPHIDVVDAPQDVIRSAAVIASASVRRAIDPLAFGPASGPSAGPSMGAGF